MQFCKVDTYIKMIHNPFRKWNFRVNWINFKSHFLKLDTKKMVQLIFQTLFMSKCHNKLIQKYLKMSAINVKQIRESLFAL